MRNKKLNNFLIVHMKPIALAQKNNKKIVTMTLKFLKFLLPFLISSKIFSKSISSLLFSGLFSSIFFPHDYYFILIDKEIDFGGYQ